MFLSKTVGDTTHEYLARQYSQNGKIYIWKALNDAGIGKSQGSLDSNKLETMLNKLTHFGLANFMENGDFLWRFGYMISQFPYYFSDYEHWEEKGISMLNVLMNYVSMTQCINIPIRFSPRKWRKT